MNDIVRGANCAGQPIGRCRHRGVAGADERQVRVLGCLGQMRMNRLDGEGAGYFTGVAAAHAVTDDIESEQRVGQKTILVVGSFEAGIGFGAVQPFK